MLLSIIIPTCNRNDLLSVCLSQLSPFKQNVASHEYEVIISDDSKGNGSKKLLEDQFPWAKWVEGPKKGPASNRNNGVQYSNGQWLLFIDDDCIPNSNLLNTYISAIASFPTTMVFEGCIKVDRKQQSLIEEAPINEAGGCLWSCNFMISRQVFLDKLTGFDEKFPFASMEDVDLRYRLEKLQIASVFLKEAQVIHPWRTQKKLISITLKRFKSTLYFLEKHPERKKDINALYYLKAFRHYFFAETIKKSISYKFKGFLPKITTDFLHLYFAFYLLFNKEYKKY
jgi:GT2 family glycosyltransferase